MPTQQSSRGQEFVLPRASVRPPEDRRPSSGGLVSPNAGVLLVLLGHTPPTQQAQRFIDRETPIYNKVWNLHKTQGAPPYG